MLAPLAAIAAVAALAGAEAGPRLEPWPDEPGRIEAWPGAERRVEIVYHQKRILAPVRIEGVGERLFIVDTAAGTSVISSALRDALAPAGADVRRQPIRGATGMIELDYVRVPGLVFGGVRHTGVWSVVADLAEFSAVNGAEIAGVLGVDVLARSDLRLDLARGVIELGAPDPGAPAARGVPFHSDAQAGFVQFTASINGAPVAAVLDTGARSGTLNWAAAGLAGLAPGAAGVVDTGARSAGIDGVGVDRVEARIDGVCLAGVCFDGAPVRVADLAVFALVGAQGGSGPSMLVGADVLEVCTAEILYSRNILRLCAE